MLTLDEKENILGSFPNIKLSYENIIHKKVLNSDLILVIPDGTKCFAWFTILNDKSVCIILQLENNNKREIKNIKIVSTCFSSSLSYGTIVYGTLFYHIKNSFFCVEDIFLYKGNDISGENWKNKFSKIGSLFKNDIQQIAYNNSFIVFGLPIMVKTNEEVINIIDKSLIKYKLHSVQYRQFNKSNSYQVLLIEEFTIKIKNNSEINSKINSEINSEIKSEINNKINKENRIRTLQNLSQNIIFEVKPDIQNDIYHLYCSGDEYNGTACIPDLKTSIMMNKLFRKIKENDDLDKLEESDDEEEFENPDVGKFVYLDKSFKIKCHYNKRFKKWTPIEIVSNSANTSNIKEINNFISNLYESNKKTPYKKK
jgi:hypothetical protein